MGLISRLYDFVAGSKIRSVQVDEELNQLIAGHNGHDGRILIVEDTITNELATEAYVNTEITQAMLGNPPLGGVTKEMLDPDIQGSIALIDKGMANLAVLAEINNVSTGQSGYGYDLFRGPADNFYSAAQIDTTKGRIASAISGGQTSVTVSDVQGVFAVGQEVTLQDVVTDSVRQRLIIQTVVGSVITFTTPTNAYAANANLYRSLVSLDAGNRRLEFGAATYAGSVITSVGASTVSASQNNGTESTNARRTVRTPRGWMIHAMSASSIAHTLYISKDNGVTWAVLCTNSTASSSSGELGISGDMVYWCMGSSNTGASLFRIDTLTQTNVDIRLNNISVTTRRFVGLPSMAIDSKGSIHISASIAGLGETVWVYCFSEDGGATFRETNVAMASSYTGNNTVVIDKNDNAIFMIQDTSSPYNMYYAYKVGNVYTTALFSGVTATNGGFNVIVKRSGSNIGRIWIVSSNAASAYSDDNGATWTTGIATGLTSGQASQLSENASGDIFCVFRDTGSSLKTVSVLNGAVVWTAGVVYDASVLTATSISTLEYGGSFTVPISIYNKTASSLIIRGTYSAIQYKDLLQVDVRYKITPPAGAIDELRSWVQYASTGTIAVSTTASIVAPGANEDYTAGTSTNTKTFLNSSSEEIYGVRSVPVAQPKVTQRITMTRGSTSELAGLSKYLCALIKP